LLEIANISSDVLGFFMVSLRIKDESLLEEHDYRLVIDLQNNISIVAKTLDKVPEGLSFLLDYAGMVLVES
jgi:hypothetical protein